MGQTQALDVATLRKTSVERHVAAFSITQDSIMTIWNVVLGVALMLWVFGFTQMKAMLSKNRSGHAAEEPSSSS